MSSEPSRRSETPEPTLGELRQKLAEEEELYARFLSELDRLSDHAAPYDQDAEIPGLLQTLNDAGALAPPEAPSLPGGLRGLLRRLGRKLVEPDLAALSRALESQRAFNSTLVQFLNRFSEATNRAAAREAEFASALVGFAQRIDRLADAKDRLYASLGNERTDLLLEAMDKRLETVRLGVQKARERLDGMSSSVALARSELSALGSRLGSPPGSAPSPVPASEDGFEEAHYLAFEERFRGDSEELKRRFADYVPYFEDRAPVVDLGCGRGEFLELLREAGIEAAGVDGNREMVHACREKGLNAEVGDLISHLSSREASSAGGVFAAQVIEHLPPSSIRKVLGDCYRVLRPEGRVILETVNPRSLVALVEAFYRDLTHQKPIHSETLDFHLRAVGFREVEIRYSSPVSERGRLATVQSEGPDAHTLNQNFEKLNAFLYGELDYAAIATK